MSSLFVDLDNDGDQDLVVGSSPLIVMENDGQGRFAQRQMLHGAAVTTSIAAADPDGDGDLDLYACNYSSRGPVPIHDANNGPPNALWRNDGDWQFANVTGEVGLDEKQLTLQLRRRLGGLRQRWRRGPICSERLWPQQPLSQ